MRQHDGSMIVGPLLVRHEGDAPRERSTCGWRYRLISREDEGTGVAAWAHAVDIDGTVVSASHPPEEHAGHSGPGELVNRIARIVQPQAGRSETGRRTR